MEFPLSSICDQPSANMGGRWSFPRGVMLLVLIMPVFSSLSHSQLCWRLKIIFLKAQISEELVYLPEDMAFKGGMWGINHKKLSLS